MKKLSFYIAMLVCAALFVSCDTDNDNEYNTGSESSGSSSSTSETDQVAQVVKQHVKAQYTTYNAYYLYDVTFTSSLESVYPNKTIKYGIETGYGDYDCYKLNNSKYTHFIAPWCVGVGNWWTYSTFRDIPVWDFTGYNGSGDLPSYSNLYDAGVTSQNIGDALTFLRSYYGLKPKEENNTIQDYEKQQLKDAKKYIEEAKISTMKQKLSVRAFVTVDGVKYNIGVI